MLPARPSPAPQRRPLNADPRCGECLSGGTLYPDSARKEARVLNAVGRRASGQGGKARRAAQAQVAAEFDAVHTVERARAVGSLDALIHLPRLRAWVVAELLADLEG